MIGGFITCLTVGIACIAIGIINMCGNINTLHSYHRHRVRPEDVKKLGRAVGIGMILCGVGTMTLGGGMLAFEITGLMPIFIISTVAFGLIMGTGLIISIVSICKYNGGLF